MASISSLQTADRLEIFRHLAVSDLNGVSEEILSHISSGKLHAFHEFCEKVFLERESIEDVSTSIDQDGELQFDIQYKK